ncbi:MULTISPECIES: LrgB family protein [Acetobacter]|jgi:putative effector of murein hydrolase|uniref:Membrane protein n=1 Tax=Acetobacter peroxydans TaxID=104098 RepID=A0A4Y3TSS6_9PROT|nr:LrgB family protein [Acetobacter peroxydans]MCH4144304.1 LrgB family protein [Acetobacter peroxydans]MCI1412358.1 LrgB family protein [Acetobacter peroxydans]MCI1440457.1 LrgB family protein [Acetobacter peroxydans]MCI1567720.1 LrgB family protein [Acetobacter peroxydans]MCI1726025.1 LrgB family protein [Acetobacter peroxydans]
MIAHLWHQAHDYVFLSPQSAALVWLCVTLGSYGLAVRMQILCGRAPWVNPVLLSICSVVLLLFWTGTPYETYFRSTSMIHFLLGPATVALAVPLAQSIGLVLRSLPAMTLALLAGSVTSVISGVGLVLLCGGSHDVALSMAPKAVTTPIAIAITRQIGGIASLTAVFAILGGIIAATCGEPLLRWFGVHDWRAHGLAAGIAGSGIAAAQVAQRDPVGAAFAALGIGLNGLVTSVLVPLFLHIFQ